METSYLRTSAFPLRLFTASHISRAKKNRSFGAPVPWEAFPGPREPG